MPRTPYNWNFALSHPCLQWFQLPRFASKLLNILILFSATQVFAGAASAPKSGPSRIVRDRQGAPRCLVKSDGSFLAFLWSRDPFEKTTYARVFKERYKRRHNSARKGGSVRREDLLRKYCYRSWGRLYLGSGVKNPPRYMPALDSIGKEISGFLVPESLRKDFVNIERGGRIGRVDASVMNPSSYLDANPIDDFTVELNRKLTNRYGPGFAAGIYEEMEARNSNNQTFLERFLENAELFSNPQLNLEQYFEKRKLILIKGLGHELNSFQRFQPLIDEMRNLKVDFSIVETASFDPIVKNGVLIQREIEKVLDTGKNVILLSMSKGAAETLWALKTLYAKWHREGKPTHYGNIETSLSMSGVYSGSFLIDWATDDALKYWIIRDKLDKEFKADGLKVKDWNGFENLAYEYMDELEAEIDQQVRDGIFDTNLPHVNVVGVLDGTGLADDIFVRQLQDDVIRTQIKEFGANDGYVEYPGTSVKQTWTESRYVLTMKSSHAFIDGKLNEMSLGDETTRRLFLGGLLLTTLEMIEGDLR